MTKTEYLNLVNTAIKKVKQFNITVIKKQHHELKLYELKALYNELMTVNVYLFDPDYSFEWKQYKTNIIAGKSKKELDINLKYCLTVINKQLKQIRQDINLIEGLID